MKNLFPLFLIFFLIFFSCQKEVPTTVFGCTDPAACNYNENANQYDSSCTSTQIWYQDLDGDSLGNPNMPLTSCNQPPGYVLNSSDDLDLLVIKKQRATVTYVGATWCGPCGANGDPAKEHMESTFGSDVVILNVQKDDAISSSGEFGPTFGSAFQSFANINSIPHVYFSGENVAMTDGGFSSSPTQYDATINAILSDVYVSVGVAATATISGETVIVKTLTKFYSPKGPNYIGVYLLEDNVMANQIISGSPDAITAHNNVVRISANDGNSLGTQSIGTSFTTDQEVSGSYTIPLQSGWNISNLQVAVVIWNSTDADGISNSIIVDVN